ncbi:hypothetical protein Ae201684P_022099 [Aphanomyces euteiches]|uniref:Nuclear speckle splicing regulatory protein 1 N-terminal domain-containing protein n=1 Tax=Aphanomyces euteiches TaxID=100861 RepID=A0A6G0WAJ4_9STRA|nr:hypothetical protein Ae201684_017843 [Aphanomyces euteiches]KAH9072522.1 hypothetical protein Ae201684P_022099 [Aphanomyces euteiches]KAH9141844.1 hypothetical protein AeRB84_014049 [Aphanomyces euteiches]
MAFSMKLKAGGKKTAKPAAQPTSSSIFSLDEPKAPEESKVSTRPPPLYEQESRPGVISKAEKAAQDALASDPNVFDYDGAYDSIQEERQKQKNAKKVNGVPQSKYIGALMEKAKIREIEHDRIRERRLLKERAEEDALYGDKEKFVTASYKRKLIESKRWEQEDARLAAIEAANDVTKQEHGMAGFYANLLTNNIAMGGDEAKAISAYTTGRLSKDESLQSPKKQKVDPEGDSSHKHNDDEVNATKPSTETASPGVAYRETDKAVSLPLDDAPAPTVAAPVPTVAAPSREDLIKAAKERYLARKQQQQSSTSES